MLKKQSCEETHLRKSSIGAQGLQAMTDCPTLLSGKKQKDQAELQSCHHNWIFEEWGKSVPPGSNIGFCCDILMAG